MDENGILLSSSVYEIHYDDESPLDSPHQNLSQSSIPSSTEQNEQRKHRASKLRKWLNDCRTPYRLDQEEILHSCLSENFCSPIIHSSALSARSLFVTSQGKLALGRNIQAGDAIAILSSCDLPFALRPVPGRDCYTLGQPVLLPGVMSGEAWPEDQKTGLEDIKIA